MAIDPLHEGFGEREVFAYLERVRNLMMLLLCLLASPAFGADEHRLQPGNDVVVTVPDPKVTETKVTIDPRGEIPLGRYGRLKIAGMTVSAAESAVRDYLGRYIVRRSGISLALTSTRFFVFVTGHVRKSGFVKMDRSETVWQAVQRAGGHNAGADLSGVVLARNGKERPLDIGAFLTRADTTPLPAVRPGDTVFVPAGPTVPDADSGRVSLLSQKALKGKVFVLGAVSVPGIYDRTPGLDPLLAIGLAGGPRGEADLSGVRVLSKERSLAVNLAAILRGDGGEILPIPEGGAIVYVPSRTLADPNTFSPSINVIGGVERPGRLNVPGPVSLAEAIGMSAGARKNGLLDEVRLVRAGPRFTLATNYDFEAYVEEGGVLAQARVQPGDLIWLEESDFQAWRAVVQVISDLAVISTAVVLFLALSERS